MIDIIKYLNQYFNLFAFENQVVVNFKNNNPVIVERISHIINYVYENYANRITLEELSEREHLSSFYLSHLIHAYMGISFQKFLCFARSEMSEIPLLETNDKISTVAKKVGFSTTAYYEKFFPGMVWAQSTGTSCLISDTHSQRIQSTPFAAADRNPLCRSDRTHTRCHGRP